jgi:hypothetical protein
VILLSCIDKKEKWLNEYQQTKCEWKNLERQLEIDSIQIANKLSTELSAIQRDLTKLSAPFEERMKRND